MSSCPLSWDGNRKRIAPLPRKRKKKEAPSSFEAASLGRGKRRFVRASMWEGGCMVRPAVERKGIVFFFSFFLLRREEKRKGSEVYIFLSLP